MGVVGQRIRPSDISRTERAKRRRVLADATNKKSEATPKPRPETASFEEGFPEPRVLPAGWAADVSTTSGEVYYRNEVTDEAQWEFPKSNAAEGAQAVERASETLRELGELGIKVFPLGDIRFGKALGAGAFGTVRQGTVQLDGESQAVAVKTLTFTRSDDFDEKLHEFKTEATVGWELGRRSRANKDSRICATLGVAHDACASRVKLHLLLEHVNCDGDMHDTIHGAKHWDCLRSCGEDTGARLRGRYTTTDADDDAWAFVMARGLKLRVAVDLAMSIHEMKCVGIVHCDIKPANMLLQTVDLPAGSKHKLNGLQLDQRIKLIDFGEANTVENADSVEVGTPGHNNATP